MRKWNLALIIAVVLGMMFAISCGRATPAPTATVTVTKTTPSAPGAAPTVTVTQTAPAVPAVTMTVTPTPTPTKLVKVRYAEVTGGTGYFFDAIGKQKGFFESRGIDLEILEMAAAAARVAPFVGQADVGAGDPLAFYPERKDIRVIGAVNGPHFGVFVRKDSPYKSYHDLKGKKISALGPASAQYQLLKTVTRLEGLDLEKDFQLVTGEATVQIGWLLNGDVEAVHLHEPHQSKLLVSDGDKVRELYWLPDLYKKLTGDNWIIGGVYTPEARVKQNPDLFRQVGLGYVDTYIYVYAHSQVWKSDTAKNLWKIADPKVLEVLAQRMPRVVEQPSYGPTYKEALIKRARLVAEAGLVPYETVDWLKEVVIFAEPWR